MSNKREVSKLMQHLNVFENEMAKEWARMPLKAAEEILTDVKATRGSRGVPKDTGALANSGRAKTTAPFKAQVTFGGAAAPYALVQHERTDYFHPQGEPRYLIRGAERFQFGKSGARALAEVAAVTAAMKANKK